MNNYTSLYKINGIPILPPLMTPEKYEECRKHKADAITIEKKIFKKQSSLDSLVSTFRIIKNDDINSQMIPYKETNTKKESRHKKLEKSDTLIYDVINNTVLIPNEKSNNCKIRFPEFSLDDHAQPLSHVRNEEKCYNLSKVPSILINSTKNINTFEIASPKSLTHTQKYESGIVPIITSPEKIIPLIRSDSFTLEAPSEALANELLKNKNASRKYNKRKLPDIEIKSQLLSIKSNNETKVSESVRRKRSPYDSKLVVKTKNLKKHRNLIRKSNKPLQKKTINDSSEDEHNESLKSNQIKKLFDQLEENRKLKLKELFEKQKDEQKKVDEIFKNQENLFLELFKNCASIQDSGLKENRQYCESFSLIEN